MIRSAALVLTLLTAVGAAHAATPSGRCWVDKGALVVAAAFGDMAGDFLVDPATPRSLLHLTRAQGDGIDTPTVERSLVVADRRLPRVTMLISDIDDRTRRFDTTINGVIGADLLSRFVVQIDWSPCRITLWRRPPAPWKGSTRLSLIDWRGAPTVAATITDGREIRSGRFLIDMSRLASQVAGATLSRPTLDLAAAARLRAVEIGGRLFEQTPATPADQAVPDGAIGTAIWSALRLRLDIRRGRLDLGQWPTSRQTPR